MQNSGGARTNEQGKEFERQTDIRRVLQTQYGFQEDKGCPGVYVKDNWRFMQQRGFARWFFREYRIKLYRYPDEAFVRLSLAEPTAGSSQTRVQVYILEKKAQQQNGSVDTKLWSGPSLKREYELTLGDSFEVHYAFCVNSFLEHKITTTPLFPGLSGTQQQSQKTQTQQPKPKRQRRQSATKTTMTTTKLHRGNIIGNPKYHLLTHILTEHQIRIFYGTRIEYYAQLLDWIGISHPF